MKNRKRLFEKFKRKAKPEDINKIETKLPDMNRGPIKEIWPKVKALYKMAKDPDVAWQSKIAPIGALLYLISPIDAIPDIIPVAGLTDDVAVILLVVGKLAKELDKYMKIRAEQKANREVEKYSRKIRITLIYLIIAALITIALKLVWQYI